MLGRVEVDVVGNLDRQMQGHRVKVVDGSVGNSVRVLTRQRLDQAFTYRDPPLVPLGHESVERVAGEDRLVEHHSEIDDICPVTHPASTLAARRGEDPVRQVVQSVEVFSRNVESCHVRSPER